ncbi:MAG TPA: phage major capsid protein [Vicinamibacterales bacterium]|nr:phage major capsid protein [Vicinamibacterales bacterium]
MTVEILEQKRDVLAARVRRMVDSTKGRDVSVDEQAEIEAAVAQVKSLNARITHTQSNESATRAINEQLGFGSRARGNSLGAQVVNSEMFQWLQERRGKLPAGAWTSPSSELQAATLTEDAASGGDLVIADYQPGIVSLPLRRLTVADLLAKGMTNSNAVTYMKQTTFTNAAAAVAEAALKPESTLAFDAVTDLVVKLAHWLPRSDEILGDVPQRRSFVDAELRRGVELTLDDQLLNGSGTAPNMRGILNRTGLATAVARGTDPNADAIAKQIAAIASASNVQPDGIIMHPTNWQTIQLSKDASGNYPGGGGPFASPRQPTLWGLPVAVTSVIAVNTALVGAFQAGAQLFLKGNLRVEATNAHSDFFTKNMTAIRAEMRAALAVRRPNTFGVVSGLI